MVLVVPSPSNPTVVLTICVSVVEPIVTFAVSAVAFTSISLVLNVLSTVIV